MEIEHFSHHHTLFFHDLDGKTEEFCDGCRKNIHGPAYTCKSCTFWLHKSCIELPRNISHPFHPQHPLVLIFHIYEDPVICDECFCTFLGFIYSCLDCKFYLDPTCASSSNDPLHAKQGQSSKDKEERRILHFGHEHYLSLLNYRKDEQYFDVCDWCRKRVSSGLCYGCLKCNYFIHKSCDVKIPRRVQHPFHPSHHLLLQNIDYRSIFICRACQCTVEPNSGQNYVCEECDFVLDVHCANNLRPTLKHKCHEHQLTHFQSKGFDENYFQCNSCGVNCGIKNNHGAFYRCVQCDFNLHFECLPIPPMSKEKYHDHPLLLKKFFSEDHDKEYFCNICEKQRNPRTHVYSCEECKYTVHIECVLNKVSSSVSHFKDAEANDGAASSKVEESALAIEEALDLHHSNFELDFQKTQEMAENRVTKVKETEQMEEGSNRRRQKACLPLLVEAYNNSPRRKLLSFMGKH